MQVIITLWLSILFYHLGQLSGGRKYTDWQLIIMLSNLIGAIGLGIYEMTYFITESLCIFGII